jgi:hypothetical protein
MVKTMVMFVVLDGLLSPTHSLAYTAPPAAAPASNDEYGGGAFVPYGSGGSVASSPYAIVHVQPPDAKAGYVVGEMASRSTVGSLRSPDTPYGGGSLVSVSVTATLAPI